MKTKFNEYFFFKCRPQIWTNSGNLEFVFPLHSSCFAAVSNYYESILFFLKENNYVTGDKSLSVLKILWFHVKWRACDILIIRRCLVFTYKLRSVRDFINFELNNIFEFLEIYFMWSTPFIIATWDTGQLAPGFKML